MEQAETVLRQVVNKLHKQRFSDIIDESIVFERLCAEIVVSSYSLDEDEIEFGLTGKGRDGGIDSLYMFSNGMLVDDNFTCETINESPVIRIYVVQSKRESSFKESTLDKLITTMDFVLSRIHDTSFDFSARFDSKISKLFSILSSLYDDTIHLSPQYQFNLFYCSYGVSTSISAGVKSKEKQLKQTISKYLRNTTVDFAYFDADHLYNEFTSNPIEQRDLHISTHELIDDDSLIAISTLEQYCDFVTSTDATFDNRLFELNIRDYQGETQVNKKIKNTLTKFPGDDDFWYLNNGITIVVDDFNPSKTRISVKRPRIVNGLQTSRSIYDCRDKNADAYKQKKILIKIIQTTDYARRDRIIEASNSQTYIPPASLKAHEPIHRMIETHFQKRNFFYDRRKGSAKRVGHSVRTTFSIGSLAQIAIATVLSKPDYARARPTSIINSEALYKQIFNESYPLELYLNAALYFLRIDMMLRYEFTDLDSNGRNNAKWLALTYYVQLKYKTTKLNDIVNAIGSSEVKIISDSSIRHACSKARQLLENYSSSNNISTDKAAKSSELAELVIQHAHRHDERSSLLAALRSRVEKIS